MAVVPTPTTQVKLRIKKFLWNKYNTDGLIDNAVKIIYATVNSSIFQQKVTTSRFYGQIPADVLAIICQGREEGTAADFVLNFTIDKSHNKHELGHFEEGVIYTTLTVFNIGDPVLLASHWMHEWMHSAGFTHPTLPWPWRSKSVPYKIGNLIAAIAPLVHSNPPNPIHKEDSEWLILQI